MSFKELQEVLRRFGCILHVPIISCIHFVFELLGKVRRWKVFLSKKTSPQNFTKLTRSFLNTCEKIFG